MSNTLSKTNSHLGFWASEEMLVLRTKNVHEQQDTSKAHTEFKVPEKDERRIREFRKCKFLLKNHRSGYSVQGAFFRLSKKKKKKKANKHCVRVLIFL